MRSIASTRRLALIAGAATLVLPLAAHAAGSITGTIKLDGQAPQRQAIKMSADPQCEAANPSGRMGDVFLVKDGKVQNVFVYVKEGLGDQKFETPAGEKPHVDQIGCMYTPRVVGVMVGLNTHAQREKRFDFGATFVHLTGEAVEPEGNAVERAVENHAEQWPVGLFHCRYRRKFLVHAPGKQVG